MYNSSKRDLESTWACVRGLGASEGFSDLMAVLEAVSRKGFWIVWGLMAGALSCLKWHLKLFGEQVFLLHTLEIKLKMETRGSSETLLSAAENTHLQVT